MLEKLRKNLKFNVGKLGFILIALCVVLVLVDLLTKIFEERYCWNFNVIPNFIEVHSGSRNPGCAFSFLSEAAWGQIFLIIVTFILIALLVGVFIFLPERYVLAKLAISLIAAGAIGNLIDRIAYREVRDFVEINMFGSMVACNFADFWIVFGTIIVVIDLLFINDWSLFPLTKSAKEAQARRKAESESHSSEKDDEQKD